MNAVDPLACALDSSAVSYRGQVEKAGDSSFGPALEDEWRRLAERRGNPFITPEWFAAAAAIHPEERPYPIVWRRDGRVAGVLPLVAVKRGPLKQLQMAGARRADWMTPACAPDDEREMGEAVADLLLRARGDWQILSLKRVEVGCTWPAALGGVNGGLAIGPPVREDVLPYIEFDERGFDGYLADRSRNFRSQLGRRRRKLEKDHGLRFRLTETAAQLPADLDTFFALHDERWSRPGRQSSQDEPARRHLRAFAAAALRRGWLRLWTAEADGDAAAAWYGWRIGDRYCYALAGLKRQFEPLGLGTVLLGHTIEQAAAEGASIYDLMWGDEEYKTRFATERRYAQSWALSRPGHPARAAIPVVIGARRRLERVPGDLPDRIGRAVPFLRSK